MLRSQRGSITIIVHLQHFGKGHLDIFANYQHDAAPAAFSAYN
jgi:hypothetical protein